MTEIIKYSEEDLVELLRSGNQSAFAYLYDNYSGALFNIIFRMIENRELAEDVLQEAFVKIWNNISGYDHTRGRLFTWMLNITRNLTIDTIRSKGYRKQHKIQSSENAVDNVSNSTNIAASFDALGIRSHLAQLKSDQKQIIDLAYFEGLTQQEISKQLALPLGTVKTKMRAAIMELRKLLQS